jgi:hypothetical protein
MTKLTPGTPKSIRSPAAHQAITLPDPPKKDAGGKVSPAAKTFSVKSPRNSG